MFGRGKVELCRQNDKSPTRRTRTKISDFRTIAKNTKKQIQLK